MLGSSGEELVTLLNQHVRCAIAALLVLAFAQASWGYSVLTHEQIIDLLWQDQIQPLLLQRFPNSTGDDLKKAHAFAYGGSLVQDMGYYPFGNKYFSDLVHYVRSGDFVLNLIQESSDLNEYAFALGALAHYASDNSGHPTINQVVGIEFPKLRKKYGDRVTYADDPKAHIRTEFGFDMVQVAKNRYTSDRYHDFVGFEISKTSLERAFQKTYGIPLQDVIANEDLAIGTFRRSVSNVIPEMTRVALLTRRKEIVADTPNFNEKKFLYYLSRTNYEKDWGTQYRKPGFGTRVLALFLRIIPKVGPFSALSFKIPSTQTEDMYIKSVDQTVQDYRRQLHETRVENLRLSNRDCDTGRETRAGEYRLTDDAYARLLDQLAVKNFAQLTPDLKQNILGFYDNPDAPIATKRNKKAWQKTLAELGQLKDAATSGPTPVKTGWAPPEILFQNSDTPPSADTRHTMDASVCKAPDHVGVEVGESR
jgi:Zinc dependent phospholipase C